MFGRGDLNQLLGEGQENDTIQGSGDGKKDSNSKLKITQKFVPKVDKTKEIYIHRRQKQKPKVGKVSSSSGQQQEARLFQEDSDEDDIQPEAVVRTHGPKSRWDKGKAEKDLSSDSSDDEDEEIIAARRKLLQKRLQERRKQEQSQEEENLKDATKSQQQAESDSSDSDAEARRQLIRQRLQERRREAQKDERVSAGSDVSSDEDKLAEKQLHIRNRLSAHKAAPTSEEATDENGEVLQTRISMFKNQSSKEKTGIPPEIERTSSSSSSASSSSESESSSSEEDVAPVRLKFVPKHKRHTIIQVQKEQELEEDRLRNEQLEEQERVKQTKLQVAQEVKRNRLEAEEKAKSKDIALSSARAGMPDDTDGQDEAAEYEAWKLRELARLKRDLAEKHARELEKLEIEKRRNMTDEERIKHDEELIKKGLKKGNAEKKQMQFMQRYYHKGAFYMDEDTLSKTEKITGKTDVRRKDYTGATEKDRKNMELLPEVMQRRNFGKKGGTKWTHLSKEDTSRGENLFAEGDRLRQKGSKQ